MRDAALDADALRVFLHVIAVSVWLGGQIVVGGLVPMVRRSNGTFSAVVALVGGSTYRFRYRSHDGTWFNDEAADGYEPNVHGSTDCLVEL